MVSTTAIKREKTPARKKYARVNRNFSGKLLSTADETIRENENLICRGAKAYVGKRNNRMTYEELVQEGRKGVWRAYKKFDPERGTRFSTYSIQWIRQALQRSTCNAHVIRLPSHIWAELESADRAIRAFEENKDPEKLTKPARRLYDKLVGGKTTVKKLRERHTQLGKLVDVASTDKPVSNEKDSAAFIDIVVDEDQPDQEECTDAGEIRKRLKTYVENLNDIEQFIIGWRTMADIPLSLDEIAALFGYTREAIRQKEINALKKLKKMIKKDPFLSECDLASVKVPRSSPKLVIHPEKDKIPIGMKLNITERKKLILFNHGWSEKEIGQLDLSIISQKKLKLAAPIAQGLGVQSMITTKHLTKMHYYKKEEQFLELLRTLIIRPKQESVSKKFKEAA